MIILSFLGVVGYFVEAREKKIHVQTTNSNDVLDNLTHNDDSKCITTLVKNDSPK